MTRDNFCLALPLEYIQPNIQTNSEEWNSIMVLT